MTEKQHVRDTSTTLYPQLYHDFSARGKDQGEEENFSLHVDDLEGGKINIAIEFLVANHERSAEFSKNFNMKTSDGNEKPLRTFYREILERKYSLICYNPRSKDIVSVNLLVMKHKNQDDGVSTVSWTCN